MSKLCLYFELHQPFRLTDYSIFDVGSKQNYFSRNKDDLNKEVFQKVSKKSYIPMLKLLKKMLDDNPGFCFTLSFSGIFLEQAALYEPEVLALLKSVVKTGRVELLSETYYHSLAALYSPQEFKYQVKKHAQLLKRLFNYTPKVFRNTELIYSDLIATRVGELGFKGMLTEAVDRYLEGQPRTQVFSSYSEPRLPLLLKHAQLSDDVAFRFSDRNWPMYPLRADTYVQWLNDYGEDEMLNLFMDFETFGEHQWVDTGIFNFFETVIQYFLASSWNTCVTPTEVLAKTDVTTKPFYKVPEPISWADVDRDLSAWIDNDLQQDALRLMYSIEEDVLSSGDVKLIDDWRRLQTSDHFYYMCIKWSADGDVHAYFSPYDTPNDAYVRFTTVLADVQGRLMNHTKQSKTVTNNLLLN